MTALALFEAKKVLRNPLLWLGALLLATFSWLNAREYWPLVTDDVGFVYQGVVVVAMFALLVGAWVGLRDRTSGATSVVASTPLKQRGLLVPARMAALAGSGIVVYLMVVGAIAVSSWVRGGRGLPDAFLALDGALYVALAACTGFAIGYLTGSRIMSLLAAPLLPGFLYYAQGEMSGRVTDPSWLLPNPKIPSRFGPLGYLPDILPIHSMYLAGMLLGLTGIVWLVASRRDRTGSARAAFASTAIGAVAFVTCAGWLALQPFQVHVFGPDRSQWVEIASYDQHRGLGRATRDPDSYPDDGFATECAEERAITVCVFPEDGPELAQALVEDAAKLAPLAGLDGVPDEFRMVPASEFSYVEGCRGGDEYLIGSRRWNNDFFEYESNARNAMYCAVLGPRMRSNRAGDIIAAWFEIRLLNERTGDGYVRAARRYGWGERASAVLVEMEPLPVDEVVGRLEPVWDELRSRNLTLDELGAVMRS